MRYKDTAKRLADYRAEIAELRTKIRAAQAEAEPEEARDYVFATPDGAVRLGELFRGKPDLFVIHNMGKSCPYCTLWADGFNGVYHHLADRAGFAVSSPDAPAVQKAFAASRGLRFPMVSHQGTSFAAEMGYLSESGSFRPGISAFRREGARILRVSDAPFSPGDDFCSFWHVLDLLPEGAGDWEPKFSYPAQRAP
jgi:predicted dithiol-disulfide oxidoreductase (DUF899 family)